MTTSTLDSPADAVDAWRNADRNARAEENLLTLAWQEVHAKRIRSLPEGLVESVLYLRGIANDKLTVAVQALSKRDS